VFQRFCVVPDPRTVGFLILIKPVVSPRLSAVAAPPTLRLVAVELRRLNAVAPVVRPPPSTLRLPLTFKVFLILVIPVGAPRLSAVAVPKAFTVVEPVFQSATVAGPIIVDEFSAVFPLTDDPTLILVIDPAAPFVPILIVFVVAVNVAPVPRL